MTDDGMYSSSVLQRRHRRCDESREAQQEEKQRKEMIRETVRNTTRGFSRFQTKANQTKTKQKEKIHQNVPYFRWNVLGLNATLYEEGRVLPGWDASSLFVWALRSNWEERGKRKKNPTHTNCGCNGRTNGTVGTCTRTRMDAASLHTCSFAVATELLLMSSLLLLLMMNECLQ